MHRWQDIGLVLLGLVTAALVLLTFRALGTDAPEGPAAPGNAPDLVSLTGAADVAGSTGEAATRTATDAGGAADADGATADAGAATAGQDAAGASAPPVPAERARAVLQQEDRVVVLALGDSTGNDVGEWTFRWAQALAETRPTSIVPWNEWTEDGYIEPEVLSSAVAPRADGVVLGEVVVWSGHQSGAPASYPANRIGAMVPEQPDLVVLNYGHNNTVRDVADELDRTLEALRAQVGDQVPVVVTLQQPQYADENAPVREAVQAWARARDLPVIDVAARFNERDDPGELLTDALHPNDEGSALWAQVVAEALGAP